MKKICFILLFIPFFVFSQEPLKRSVKILYKHQRHFGVNVHFLGWGVHGRKVWNDNVRWQHFLEADIVSMKHPKQVKKSQEIERENLKKMDEKMSNTSQEQKKIDQS